MRIVLYGGIIVGIVGIAWLWKSLLWDGWGEARVVSLVQSEMQVDTDSMDERATEAPQEDSSQREIISENTSQPQKPHMDGENLVQKNIPFLSQAPSAQWSDPVYQDGCEEASMIMADAWLRTADTIDTQEGENKIREITQYAESIFGDGAIDLSAQDTARVFEQFFFHETSVRRVESSGDMLDVLYEGGVLIIPADGRRLHNPHFVQPGPERHMLLVHGYDSAKKEFITHDPGTRYGRNYRYDEEVLFGAIRDYPTGNHEPILRDDKYMIVIMR